MKLLPHSLTYSTPFNNHGNYIISLGQLTPWLAQKAESLGVEVFPGFAAAAPCSMRAARSRACASATWASTRTASPGRTSPPASEIHARPDGARRRRPRLRSSKTAHRAASRSTRGHCPQTFALGYKELWQLPAGRVQPGRIEHALGWPAGCAHLCAAASSITSTTTACTSATSSAWTTRTRASQPFEAFQQYKNHPSVKALLEGGEILSAGARTIAAGGWQSTPTLEMPGAILIGDAGGTLNFAKIKGVHQAIRSRRAGRRAHRATAARPPASMPRWRASPGGQELKTVRNFKPGFKRGLWFGLANSALGNAHRRHARRGP